MDPKEEKTTETPEADPPKDPKPAWQYREMRDWGINKRMVEIVKMTLKVSEAEADALRRKLERLQYGS